MNTPLRVGVERAADGRRADGSGNFFQCGDAGVVGRRAARAIKVGHGGEAAGGGREGVAAVGEADAGDPQLVRLRSRGGAAGGDIGAGAGSAHGLVHGTGGQEATVFHDDAFAARGAADVVDGDGGGSASEIGGIPDFSERAGGSGLRGASPRRTRLHDAGDALARAVGVDGNHRDERMTGDRRN